MSPLPSLPPSGTPSARERRPVRELPLARLIPNMLTLMALCSGLTAVRFALAEQWDKAVLAIVAAAIFDVLDGRVARMMGLASRFGAELDSLADLVAFGVAPALTIYFWALQDIGRFGWLVVLAYTVCMALRLARFNTMLEDQTAPAWTKSFFNGVPAPSGAGLALIPLIVFLQWGESAHVPSVFVAVWLLVVGGLLISRLPTLSLKGRRISSLWVAPFMVGMGLFFAALITNTWLTMTVSGGLYLASLPYAWFLYRRRERQDEKASLTP